MAEGTPGGAPESVWIDGSPRETVSVLERALHYGDGLFETIACPHGQPRLLGAHLARLAAGCARLALPMPPRGLIEAEICALAREGSRSIVKLILSRGAGLRRGYRPSGEEKATRILLRYPWAAYDPALEREGVRVRTARTRLGENAALAGIKHLNRLEQVLASSEDHDGAIAEALMYSSSGALICGTMSNVFLVREATVVTPALDLCGVAGVMRQLVMQSASAAGIALSVRRLGQEDLGRAHEIFLTNALIGIRPVRELDGRAYASGPLTQRLQGLLAPHLAAAPGACS